MAAQSALLASIQPIRHVQFSNETDCTAWDVFQYEDEDDVEIIEEAVGEASLPGWLATVESRPPTQPSRRLKGGLRILVAKLELNQHPRKEWSISLSNTGFDLINKQFGLHELFMDLLLLRVTQAFTHSTTRRIEAHPACLFVNFDHLGHVSLIHNPDTKISYGILVLGSTYTPSAEAKTLLHSQLKTYNHPFLLLLCLVRPEINVCFSNINSVINEIDRIQNVTGQVQNRGMSVTDVLLLDFTEITRSLNFFAETSSSSIFRLKRLSVALSIFEDWNVSLSPRASDSRYKDGGSGAQAAILEKLDYLRKFIEAAISYGELAEKRIETYRQLIYQLTTQKDSRANIELAKNSAAIAKAAKEDGAVMRQIALETKRDSKAMKTIAMLTMVFLPATSIAAIFAMPVIQWDRWDNKITAFSLYWVVTLPLTLVVFMVWGGATVLPWRSWLAKRGGGGRRLNGLMRRWISYGDGRTHVK